MALSRHHERLDVDLARLRLFTLFHFRLLRSLLLFWAFIDYILVHGQDSGWVSPI